VLIIVAGCGYRGPVIIQFLTLAASIEPPPYAGPLLGLFRETTVGDGNLDQLPA
jgi:hypothetical protein